MARKRLLLVVNAKASRATVSLDPAISVFDAAGFEVDVRRPTGARGLRELVRRHRDGSAAVVLAGGDGTINCTLPELLGRGCPLGILPLGTANDLARTLGIPNDPEAAARIVAAGNRRRIDVGEANGHPFVNVASIGLAVRVTEHLKEERKRHWGVLSYPIAALEALSEADRFHALIHCEGNSHEVHAYQIAVGNGVHYGGGMTVAQDAAIDDGVLNVHAIESGSVADLVAQLPAILTGRHEGNDQITALRCRSLRIETDRPVAVSTDGEIATETPVDFTVRGGALEVLAPAP